MADPDQLLSTMRVAVLVLFRSASGHDQDWVRVLVGAVRELDAHLSWGGDPPRDWRAPVPSLPFTEPDSGVADLLKRI